MPGGGPQSADAREETPGMKVLCAIDGSRHSQWALFTRVRDETAETPSETGVRSLGG